MKGNKISHAYFSLKKKKSVPQFEKAVEKDVVVEGQQIPLTLAPTANQQRVQQQLLFEQEILAPELLSQSHFFHQSFFIISFSNIYNALIQRLHL